MAGLVVPAGAVVRDEAATVAVGGPGIVVVGVGATGLAGGAAPIGGTVVVAGVVTAGVVTVTTPEFVPPELVAPSPGTVLEQNGTPALGAVVADEVVLVLDTGSAVALVVDVVDGDATPSPLPPSPGTPATAVAERGPMIAIAMALVASNRINLVRGGCWRGSVPRSGGSGIPRFKRTSEPQAPAQVAVRRLVITGWLVAARSRHVTFASGRASL